MKDMKKKPMVGSDYKPKVAKPKKQSAAKKKTTKKGY
jgi:hypothetical protein